MPITLFDVDHYSELCFSTTSIPLRYAEGEASYIINGVQATAYSLRFASASSRA
jgi:hypothetical protein